MFFLQTNDAGQRVYKYKNAVIKLNANVVDHLLFHNRSMNDAKSDFKFLIILCIGALHDINFTTNSIEKDRYEFMNMMYKHRVGANIIRMTNFIRLITHALAAAKKIHHRERPSSS